MKYGKVDGYGSVPKKKRHRGVVVGSILFFIVLLVIGGLFCYKLMFSRNSIQMLLDSTYDYLENIVDNSDYDSVVGTFSIQMDFQSSDEVENEIWNIFNKLDFSGNYGIDYDKNIMSFDIESDYDDKDLIDMSIYTEYGRAYVYLDGLYDKYIDVSIDDYSSFFERNLDAYKTVIVSLRKAMEETLKDEYFTEEKVTVNSEKLTKTTLDLTGENYQEWNKNFTEILLENEAFLESYAQIFDKNVEDVKKELNDMLEEEKDYEGEEYILYTNKLEIVKFEMNNPEVRIVVENNDDKYEYEVYENGLILASGSIEVTTKENINTILLTYYDDEEGLGFKMSIDVSINKNGKVENKDVTNSISSEKISEDDVNSIYNKLMENEGVVKIIEEISKLIDSSEDDSSVPMIIG